MDAALLEYSLKLVFPTPRPIRAEREWYGWRESHRRPAENTATVDFIAKRFPGAPFSGENRHAQTGTNKPFHPTQRIVPDKRAESAFRCVDK